MRLNKLVFSDCKELDFSDLSPCIALEDLWIWGDETKFSGNDDLPSIDYASFLPNLTTFTSHVCLGKLGSILDEQLSSLVSLDLKCSHLGTKGSKFNWDNIPPGWSNLQVLELDSVVGLSIENVHCFASKLKKLKKLSLPQKLIGAQREPENNLKHQLLQGPSKCHLDFNGWHSSENICLYQKEKLSHSSSNPKRPRLN